MASQKPKRPSMLTRQRQLRAQQQQVRNASRNQLPSAGGSSGNSNQARNQRANTLRQQATRNQQVVARGTQRMINRLNAQDKLDRAAAGTGPSGTTRTAGAGGGLARVNKPTGPRRQLPPSGQAGNRVRIGNSSQPWGEQPVRQVKVRDLGSTNQLSGSTRSGSRPALPAAQQGPQPATRRQSAQARADAAARGTRGPNRVGQPAGEANRVYGANRVNAAVDRAVSSTRSGRALSMGRAGGAAAVLGAAEAVLGGMNNPYGRAVRKGAEERDNSNLRALQNIGALRKPGNKPATSKPKPPIPASRDLMNSGSTDARFRKPAATRPTPTQSGGGSTPNRGGGGAVSTSSRSTRPTASTSMPQAVVNPPKPFNPNRGTSKSDNPLLDREGGYLRSKMKDREAVAQAESASRVDTKFNSNSDLYTPTTKVDGSQYADKKPDMKKVDEYNRRKRRYYD